MKPIIENLYWKQRRLKGEEISRTVRFQIRQDVINKIILPIQLKSLHDYRPIVATIHQQYEN